MISIQPPANLKNEMVAALAKVTANFTADVRAVVNDGLLEIETQAKENAPVKTGRYRASIHAVAVGMRDTFARYRDLHGNEFDGTLTVPPKIGQNDAGYVGTNVSYAREIEFGKAGRSEPWWGSYPIKRAVNVKLPRIQTALRNLKLRGMPTAPIK